MNIFGKVSTVVISSLLLMIPNTVIADIDIFGKLFGGWRVSGFDRQNSADSSPVSRLTKSNINDLKLKWIYNIAPIALTAPEVSGGCPYRPGLLPPAPGALPNPCDNARPGWGASSQPSLDRLGRLYVPTFDGRMIILDSKRLSGTLNADGTAKPVVLKHLDLFSGSQFGTAADIASGKMVYASRMFPTLVGNGLFAGNYGFWPSLQPGSVDPAWGPYDSSLIANYDWSNPKYNQKGTHTPSISSPNYQAAGGVLYKLDRRTGALIWKTVVDSNPNVAIPLTGGTPIFRLLLPDLLIVPFASSNISGTLGTDDIALLGNPYGDPFGGHCCDARGGIAAVRVTDGSIAWKTYYYPKQNFPADQLADAVIKGQIDAWTGGSTWGGGHLPFSKKLNMIFAGTNEAFSAPIAASACETDRLNNPNAPGNSDPNKCLRFIQGQNTPSTTATFNDNVVESLNPRVNSPTLPLPDAVVAMDVTTGKIKWARPVGGFDVWNLSCFGAFGFGPPYSSPSNFAAFCPSYLKAFPFLNFVDKDADLAAPPVLIENVKMANNTYRDIVIGAGKAGGIHAFDAATGATVWPAVPFNPGFGQIGTGAFMYGMTTDGKRIYGATGNTNFLTKAQRDAPGNPYRVVQDGSCLDVGFDVNGNWIGGLYVAVDLATGKIAWQRCAIGQIGANNRPLTTKTPVADCMNNAPVNPASRCASGNASAGLSHTNGIIIAGGISNYQDQTGMTVDQPFGEVLLLDAATGALLKELPMGVLGKPTANSVVYNRSFMVGKNLFISSGNHQFRSDDPTENGYRVVMYHLASDNDDYGDDKDQDLIYEED